jgi:hypothetical protein
MPKTKHVQFKLDPEDFARFENDPRRIRYAEERNLKDYTVNQFVRDLALNALEGRVEFMTYTLQEDVYELQQNVKSLRHDIKEIAAGVLALLIDVPKRSDKIPSEKEQALEAASLHAKARKWVEETLSPDGLSPHEPE